MEKSVTVQIPTLNLSLNLIKPNVEIKYYIIYKTTNLVKGDKEKHRFYVGFHIQYNNVETFDNYYGSGVILKESIKKYGKENFIREVLEICSLEEANKREVYWIEKLKANKRRYPNNGGMNLSDGGLCKYYHQRKHSQETKDKIRDMKIGLWAGDKNPSKNPEILKNKFGVNNPAKRPEVREKIKNSLKGRVVSEETKNKLRGQKRSKETIEKIKLINIGRVCPLEKRKKQSELLKEKFNTPEYKEYFSKRNSGDKNPNCKWNYILSNNENFYQFFSKEDQRIIKSRIYKKEQLEFNGIIISREKRRKNE